MRHPAPVLLAASLLALLPLPAGAQPPAQLFDRYTATGDPALLAQVSADIQSLPEGYAKRMLSARLLLASGKYRDALNEARKLNAEAPDDLDGYALIVDSALALGQTGEAERAAQWMLDLRDRDVRSLLRAAAVREELGDLTGSQEMLLAAFQATSDSEKYTRAAIVTSAARLAWKLGQTSEADRLLKRTEEFVLGFRPAAALRERIRKAATEPPGKTDRMEEKP
jgi:tetratricopeptide (TPR) repeat protein